MTKKYKKLTNKIVDEILLDRHIKRLGDYSGVDTKIQWLCLIDDCGYEWNGMQYHIQ